jgi:hypothetical protein
VGLGSWPACGMKGCVIPPICKVEHVEGGVPISAFLCFIHIFRARECIAEMAALQAQERERERLEAPDGP